MNRISRFIACMAVLTLSPYAFAIESAESNTISVNPSVYVFKEVAPNSETSSVDIQVKNTSSTALLMGNLSLTGDHAGQFRIDADACSGASLTGNSECTVSVTYSPTSRGHKQALLNIPSNADDTPVLQTFLTSREDNYHQSSRRLPPVLYNVNIPEIMTSGQTYTLEWSILGYHDDYISSLVMFDCSDVNDNTCGDSYSDATRFFSTGAVSNHLQVSTTWHHGDIYATEFKFTTQFTPSFGAETPIVVRFYRLNLDDKAAGLGGLSLIIPGNHASEYYDKEGRRIKKTILSGG